MTNTIFPQGLPDFDSPVLEEEIKRIADSDRDLLAQISTLLENLNWHEKMAVCQTAVSFIDNMHRKLLKLVPIHGELSEPVLKAMRLVEGLSLQALAELVEEILQEDFEGEIEVEDES